jgi:prepilin-type N-terminal cleavage/methylation domain-containing protein
MSGMFSRRQRPRGRRGGFTLIELMVALVVSAIVISLAARLASDYMSSTNTATWVAQVQHDISRFSRLLKTEVNEACLVQVDTSPSTTATAPSTPCTPPVSACSTTAGTTLYLLLPVTLVDGSVTYRVISYSRNGSDLRRTGPPIAADGSLDTTQSDVSNVVVMDNLVNGSGGFRPSVDSSCTTATMSVQYAVPNGGGTVSRTHVFPIGVNFTRS